MRQLVPIANLVAALILALCVLSLVLVLLGHRPDATVSPLFRSAFGTRLGLSETLLATVPVLLCAFAAAIPMQAGLINIGGEGQFHLGAIACAVMASSFHDSSVFVLAVLMATASAAAGAAWAAIPGTMRARHGINEALVSLFLNYVAIHLLRYLVHGPLRDPSSFGWPMGAVLPNAAILTGIAGSRLHYGLFLALGVGAVLAAAVRGTRIGTELRAVGLNPRTSAVVGIPVRWYLFGSMICGGLLAGMAGYFEIAAVQHRLRTDISLGFGYSGFLIAWMCGERLWLIFPLSVLVAGLISSAETLQITSGLPAASGDVIQGLLLLFVLIGQSVIARCERARALASALKTK